MAEDDEDARTVDDLLQEINITLLRTPSGSGPYRLSRLII